MPRPVKPPAPLPDRDWFPRTDRNYRLRASGAGTGIVAVRKTSTVCGDRFLRVVVRKLPVEADFDNAEALAAIAWWKNAWPGVDDSTLKAAMRRSPRQP